MKNINESSDESFEALVRIPVCIVTGVILSAWKMLISVLVVINFFMTLFGGKRSKEIAMFCEIWNTQSYIFLRYVTFVSNERPFPFSKMAKNISSFQEKI